MISDGESNNMIMLTIAKVQHSDEDKYRLLIENCHGSDEAPFHLFVSGEIIPNLPSLEWCSNDFCLCHADATGIDFRTMLKKKQNAPKAENLKGDDDDDDSDMPKFKPEESDTQVALF